MKARHEFWCVLIVLAVLGAAIAYCDYRAGKAQAGRSYLFRGTPCGR